MDWSIKRKMDGDDWFIILLIIGMLGGGFYAGLVESPNPWIIGLFMLPSLALGVIWAGFFLMILLAFVWALASWLWEKLTNMILFLRFLWCLYTKKNGLPY